MESRSLRERALVVALVENRPDVLPQTISLLHRRAFKLESLVFGTTETEGVGRLTLGLGGPEQEARRLVKELGRLLYVLNVGVLDAAADDQPFVERQMALIKVAVEEERRSEVLQLFEVFRARVLDVSKGSVVAELTGDGTKIGGLMEVLRPFGILEMARMGPVAMTRGSRALLQVDGEPSTWLEQHQRSVVASSN